MVNVLLWVFGLIIMLSSISSAIYSVRSRRSTDARLRGLYAARMNMSMGIMLIFIALIQMFMFSGSSIRVVVGSLFILLGIFNLFAGLRSNSYYNRVQ